MGFQAVVGSGVREDGEDAARDAGSIRAPTRSGRLLAVALAAVPVAALTLFGAVEDEHALPLEAAALILGAGALVARARRGAPALPAASLTLPVLLLAALPALQLLPLPAGAGGLLAPGAARFQVSHLRSVSVYPYATEMALLRWLAYAAFLIAALEILPRRGAAVTAASAVGLLGIVEAFLGIRNMILGSPYLLPVFGQTLVGQTSGTLVNRNHYAALLVLALPVLLARRWLARPAADGHGLTASYLVGGTGVGLAIALTGSRSGAVCLAAALLVAARLARGVNRGRGAMAALGLYTLLSSAYMSLGQLAERFERAPQELQGTRVALWQDALALARDFPLLGAGAGTFDIVFPAYRHALRAQEAYSHAHQDYLELAAEGGILALGLAFFASMTFARHLRRGLARASGRERLALSLLTGGIVAMLLHAAVDFPLHVPGLVFLFLLVAALAYTLARENLTS